MASIYSVDWRPLDQRLDQLLAKMPAFGRLRIFATSYSEFAVVISGDR